MKLVKENYEIKENVYVSEVVFVDEKKSFEVRIIDDYDFGVEVSIKKDGKDVRGLEGVEVLGSLVRWMSLRDIKEFMLKLGFIVNDDYEKMFEDFKDVVNDYLCVGWWWGRNLYLLRFNDGFEVEGVVRLRFNEKYELKVDEILKI